VAVGAKAAWSEGGLPRKVQPMVHDTASPRVDLVQYARERDALLRQVRQVLQTDQRVNAAWLSGSYGRREADEWSDLDLHLAIDDTCVDQFLDERRSLFSRVGWPILVQEDMASNAQTGARFQLVMYSGPIEVDWNIGSVSLAARPSPSRCSRSAQRSRSWVRCLSPGRPSCAGAAPSHLLLGDGSNRYQVLWPWGHTPSSTPDRFANYRLYCAMASCRATIGTEPNSPSNEPGTRVGT
jgi:predicted nucleotidyltransferase